MVDTKAVADVLIAATVNAVALKLLEVLLYRPGYIRVFDIIGNPQLLALTIRASKITYFLYFARLPLKEA